jgi:hypothetical protein
MAPLVLIFFLPFVHNEPQTFDNHIAVAIQVFNIFDHSLKKRDNEGETHIKTKTEVLISLVTCGGDQEQP